jgi:hypothetical protein
MYINMQKTLKSCMDIHTKDKKSLWQNKKGKDFKAYNLSSAEKLDLIHHVCLP